MGALSGLKILDFSTLLPGPYATMMLADMGAEVLKISMRGKTDIALDYPPYLEQDPALSANQAWLNRNKKTMFLNLKKPEAKEIIKKLLSSYDIIMEQNRPGTMDRLGLGYETLREINPRLIYCSLTGYGQTGPMRLRAGHDINYLARSGNMGCAGRRADGPSLTNIQIADVASGAMNCVVAILAAVQYRKTTGKGQHLDVAMMDGLLPFTSMDGTGCLAGGPEPQREGCRLNGGSAYDFYETADGRYMSVGALEPKFWAAFCTAIGCPELILGGAEPEDVPALKARIRAVMRTKTQREWVSVFEQVDACVEPVLTVGEALREDPQVKAREMVVDVPLPLQPDVTVRQLGFAFKMSESPAEYRHGGYPLGYHTHEVLAALGYTPEQMCQLEETEVC